MQRIDLNADLGEGGSCDSELLRLVSSTNISCGAHAGNRSDIDRAIRDALDQGVRIGAHPSYPDRAGFGRRALSISDDDLHHTLTQQIAGLRDRVAAAGGHLHHVKPHGALYNRSAHDTRLAALICDVIQSISPKLALVMLADSPGAAVVRGKGIPLIREAFADRRYRHDGSLTPREHPAALITDPEESARQVLTLVSGRPVRTLTGHCLHLQADTVCLHGDHPEALASARHLHRKLTEQDVRIIASGHEH